MAADLQPTFTRFPDLPMEIRLPIWRYALSTEPRIVHLKQKKLTEPEDRLWWARVRSDVHIDDPIDNSDVDKDRDGGGDAVRAGYRFRDSLDRPKQLFGFTTECETPALSLACFESRQVALERYQPVFSSLGMVSSKIYMHFEQDTLLIDHNTFIASYYDVPEHIESDVLPDCLSKVQYLVVESLAGWKVTYKDVPMDEGKFTQAINVRI